MRNRMNMGWRAGILLAAMAIPAIAQLTYPGCGPVQPSDFTAVPLVTNRTNSDIEEPLKLALARSPQGNVDIYFTQRHGMVRRYNGDTKTLTTLIDFRLGISGTNSLGLVGIALDPVFSVNGWIYLFIAPNNTWRIARFTLSGDKIDPASEKVLLSFNSGRTSRHTAGALRFDWDGNLWATVADNEVTGDVGKASSFLGKIIRIKPRPFADTQNPAPGKGSTYDIPAGNLFPEGTAGALPEIYVMGVRNPYSIGLDPVRKAVAWGDVGPDNFSGQSTNPSQFTEEHNFTTKPGNFGWPTYAGKNIKVGSGGSDLPAIPAINSYNRDAAISGPIYYFDPSNSSKIKFPPHFHGAWLLADLNRSWIDVAALNPAGTEITEKLRIFAYNNPFLKNPIDLDFGPDGALYLVNYFGYRTTSPGTGLIRIEYKGACNVPVSAPPLVRRGSGVDFSGGTVRIDMAGPWKAEVRNLAGRVLWRREGVGPLRHDLAPSMNPGLHVLMISHPSGRFTAKFVRQD